MAKGSFPVDPGRGLAFNAGSRPFYFSELEDGLAKIIRRNMINFRAVMSSHIKGLNEPINSGDSVSIDSYFAPTSQTLHRTLLSGVDFRFQWQPRVNRFAFSYRDSGDQRIDRDVTGLTINSGVYYAGITMTRAGDNLTFTSGSQSATVSIADIKSFVVTDVGENVSGLGGSDNVDGFLANLDFGPGRSKYPLDDRFINSNVIRNSAATLGPNQSIAVEPVNLDGIAEGDLVFEAAANVVAGITYRIEATVSNYTGTDTVGFATSRGVGAAPRINGNGTLSSVFTATQTGAISLFARSTNSATFTNIRVQEAPGYGTAYGLGAGDSEPYTLLTGVGYLQVESPIPQPINVSSDWVATTGATLTAPNQIMVEAVGQGASIALSGGGEYRVSADIQTTAASVQLKDSINRQGSDPTLVEGSSIAVMNQDYDVATGGLYIRNPLNDVATMTVNSLTAQRLLRFAP